MFTNIAQLTNFLTMTMSKLGHFGELQNSENLRRVSSCSRRDGSIYYRFHLQFKKSSKLERNITRRNCCLPEHSHTDNHHV